MPRIRSIKPELWLSPQVMNLSHGARLLFLGLITLGDDHGRGNADIRKLKAAIFPGDDVLTATVREWLLECSNQRLAVLYSAEDFGELYALPTWDAHQYVPKRAPTSRYPAPPKATGKLPERSGSATGGSEGSKGSKGSDARAREAVDNSTAAPARTGPDGLKTDAESRRLAVGAVVADLAAAKRLTA